MYGLRQDGQRLVWEGHHETVIIEPWGRDILRVRTTLAPRFAELPNALLEAAPTDVAISIDDEAGTITNGLLTARIEATSDPTGHTYRAPGALSFHRSDTGAELLAERHVTHILPPARTYYGLGGDLYRTAVRFKAYEDEHIYGMGQHQHGRLDQKGCSLELQQATEVTIPFCSLLVAMAFSGTPWHGPRRIGRNVTRWIADAARNGLLVFAGESDAEIWRAIPTPPATPPTLPEWAAGFWQCKLRYPPRRKLLCRRPRVQAARAAPLGHRHRLFPLDRSGRLAVRPRVLAGSGGHGARTGGDGREGDGLGLAHGQPQEPRTMRSMQQHGLLIAHERGVPAHTGC